LNKKGQLTATARRPSRGVPKFYDWLRLRLSTAAAETFYGLWTLRRRLGGLAPHSAPSFLCNSRSATPNFRLAPLQQ